MTASIIPRVKGICCAACFLLNVCLQVSLHAIVLIMALQSSGAISDDLEVGI